MMIFGTDQSLLLTTKADLIRPDRVIAEWTHRSIVPNDQFLYIAGNYVEADKPNENRHFWAFEDLTNAQSTITNSPINMGHQPHNIVGVMVDHELIYPEALSTEPEEQAVAKDFSSDEREELAKKGHALPDGSFPIENASDLRNAIQAYGRAKNKEQAKKHIIKRARALGETALLPDDWVKATLLDDDSTLWAWMLDNVDLIKSSTETALAYDHAKPYVEMLGALWRWYFPQTIAQVEAAQEMGALWISMECFADSVTRVDEDGTTADYPFRGGNIKAYDFHQGSSHVRLNEPHFVGCGLILPPAKPGWKGAEVRNLMAAVDVDTQEQLYEYIKAETPQLSPELWEDLMVSVCTSRQANS